MEEKKIYRKQKKISELKVGEKVNDIFVVKIKSSLNDYNGKNGKWFKLQLSDNQGANLEYLYFGGVDEEATKKVHDMIKSDSIIYIEGEVSVNEYNGKITNQIKVSDNNNSIIRVLEKGEYLEEDFIAKSEKDLTGIFDYVYNQVDLIQEDQLKIFIKDVLEEQKNFKIHCGAISIHHAWVGGLLEHTFEVLSYCMEAKKLHAELNGDLLIAGSILHDIGKIKEMEMTTRIKATKNGNLKGHIFMGASYIQEKLKNYKISDDIKDKIVHIILSHHGKQEFGSPKVPMLPEAVCIYYADEMSSKISQVITSIKNIKDVTEDDFMFRPAMNQGHNIFLR